MTATDDRDRELSLRAVHLAVGISLALVVLGIVILSVGRVAGFAHLREAISGADYTWLAVCLVGQTAVFAGYAGSLRSAVAADHRLRMPIGLSLRLVLASFAATQVFAFGGVAGLAVVYWALRRLGMPRDEAAVRLIGLNTAVYLVFGVLAFVAATVSIAGGAAPAGMAVPWLVGVPVAVLLARWFTDGRRVDRWARPDAGLMRQAFVTGVGAAAWVRRMLTNRSGRPLFSWAALYWVGDVASLWAALHAFGASPPLAGLTLAYATGYLVQSLPIPLIATGGVDAATTVLLHAVGVPLDLALAGVVCHRLFAFWLPVVPGAVLAVSLPRWGQALAPVQADGEPAQRHVGLRWRG